MADIISLSYALKRLNEIVHLNNGFKKYCQLVVYVFNMDSIKKHSYRCAEVIFNQQIII